MLVKSTEKKQLLGTNIQKRGLGMVSSANDNEFVIRSICHAPKADNDDDDDMLAATRAATHPYYTLSTPTSSGFTQRPQATSSSHLDLLAAPVLVFPAPKQSLESQ